MYRTVTQIDSLMGVLAQFFPSVFKRVRMPERSVRGRRIYALRMRAGGGGARRGVLIVGGTHARELMNPDAILELAVDLLIAHLTHSGITYGGRSWTSDDIRLIVGAFDIWLLPCVNPDGRDYVMTTDDMWRKNRRINAGTSCVGVDLNRNADVVWGVAQGQTSCSPCSEVYCGSGAFSEPEGRNVRHLLDTARIVSFVDVHSYSELVLYPWGHAQRQSSNPAQRFTGLATGTCTASIPASYREYMSPRDVQRFERVSAQIVDDIAAVRGRHYTAEPSISLYPTTGTLGDYAYSRHIADTSKHKTYGFTFETGPYIGNARDSFHPSDPSLIKRDTKAGLLGLLQQSVCAIELIGIRKRFISIADIASLRKTRDELLATTAAGRKWIALFERVQAPLLAAALRDVDLMKEAAYLVRLATKKRADAIVLSAADAARAIRLVKKLRAVIRSRTVREDLDAVAARTEQIAGKSMRRLLESLMGRPPASGRRSAKPYGRGRTDGKTRAKKKK